MFGVGLNTTIYWGEVGAIPDKVDRKCALKVWIAHSAAFLRWIWGGTNWYPTPYSELMMCLYSVLASLSSHEVETNT